MNQQVAPTQCLLGDRMDIKIQYELTYKKLRRFLMRFNKEKEIQELDESFRKGMVAFKR